MSDIIQSDTIDLVEKYRGVCIYHDRVTEVVFVRASEHPTSYVLHSLRGWQTWAGYLPNVMFSSIPDAKEAINRHFGYMGSARLEDSNDAILRKGHDSDKRGCPADADECWNYASMLRRGDKLDAEKMSRVADILTQYADRLQRFV